MTCIFCYGFKNHEKISKCRCRSSLDICLMTLFCMDLDDLHILLWISRCTSRSSLDLDLDLDHVDLDLD